MNGWWALGIVGAVLTGALVAVFRRTETMTDDEMCRRLEALAESGKGPVVRYTTPDDERVRVFLARRRHLGLWERRRLQANGVNRRGV